MNDKPQIKREVALDWEGENIGTIHFYATLDALEDIKEFGLIETMAEPNKYHLTVDARYDFQEVVSYIKNYG